MKISEKTLSLMRRIYGAVCSLMLALSAVLFIISAVTVNQSGSSPFTYESIGNAFSRIAVPVYVTLALLVVGGVFFGYIVTEGKEIEIGGDERYEGMCYSCFKKYQTEEIKKDC